MVYRSLETDSRKVARQRPDMFAAADDQRWSEIAPSCFGTPSRDVVLHRFRYVHTPLGCAHGVMVFPCFIRQYGVHSSQISRYRSFDKTA